MNDRTAYSESTVDRALIVAVDQYGPAILNDTAKLRNLLASAAPGGSMSQVGALLAAVAQRVPHALLASASDTETARLMPALVDRMMSLGTLRREQAAWVVRAWANALAIPTKGLDAGDVAGATRVATPDSRSSATEVLFGGRPSAPGADTAASPATGTRSPASPQPAGSTPAAVPIVPNVPSTAAPSVWSSPRTGAGRQMPSDPLPDTAASPAAPPVAAAPASGASLPDEKLAAANISELKAAEEETAATKATASQDAATAAAADELAEAHATADVQVATFESAVSSAPVADVSTPVVDPSPPATLAAPVASFDRTPDRDLPDWARLEPAEPRATVADVDVPGVPQKPEDRRRGMGLMAIGAVALIVIVGMVVRQRMSGGGPETDRPADPVAAAAVSPAPATAKSAEASAAGSPPVVAASVPNTEPLSAPTPAPMPASSAMTAPAPSDVPAKSPLPATTDAPATTAAVAAAPSSPPPPAAAPSTASVSVATDPSGGRVPVSIESPAKGVPTAPAASQPRDVSAARVASVVSTAPPAVLPAARATPSKDVASAAASTTRDPKKAVAACTESTCGRVLSSDPSQEPGNFDMVIRLDDRSIRTFVYAIRIKPGTRVRQSGSRYVAIGG